MEPLAPFPEFMKGFLADSRLQPRELARRLSVQESTVLGWLSGITPGRQLFPRIEEMTGYRFNQRSFDVVREAVLSDPAYQAHAARFPAHAATAAAAKSPAALRALIRERAPDWQIAALGRFFGFPRSTSAISDFMNDRGEYGQDTFERFLRALPGFLAVAAGECRSIHEPAKRLLAAFVEMRTRRGLSAEQCARMMRLPRIYFAKLEEHRDREFIRDASAVGKIGRFLAESGVAVMEFPDGVLSSAPSVAAAPVEGINAGEDDADVISSLLAHLRASGISVSDVARELNYKRSTFADWVKGRRRVSPDAIKQIRSYLARAAEQEGAVSKSEALPGTDLRDDITDLKRRVAALESGISGIPGAPFPAKAEDAAIAGPAERAVPADGSVRFIFTRESFSAAAEALRPAEVEDTRRLVEELRRRLNLFAAVSDEPHRREIRETLGPELDELYNSMTAFGRTHPFASVRAIEENRKFDQQYWRKERGGK